MSSTIRTIRPTRSHLTGVRGRVITADDPSYDQARTVFYGGIDKQPSAIIRVSDVEDVRRVIRTAREQELELALRSGGHSVVGHCTTDGGLVIDLRSMAKIEIDPVARSAWVETGATAIQVTEALSEHGLVVGFGDSGSVGVGGITVGGGILVLPATPETIAGFTAASIAAPNELSTIGNVMPAPLLPFLPKELHGRLVILAFIAFAGDDRSAERAIAPFRSLATPHADMVKPGPYVAMYPPEDPNYHPTAVGRTLFVNAIDKPTAETILDYLTKSDAAMRVAQIRVLGGALALVPAAATAYAHRSQPILVNVAAFYQGDADRGVRKDWATQFARTL